MADLHCKILEAPRSNCLHFAVVRKIWQNNRLSLGNPGSTPGIYRVVASNGDFFLKNGLSIISTYIGSGWPLATHGSSIDSPSLNAIDLFGLEVISGGIVTEVHKN